MRAAIFSSSPSERRFLSWFQARRRLTSDAHDAPDEYLVETRAAQLSETLKLTRYSATTPVVVAAVLVALFWSTPNRAYAINLFALVGIPSFIAVGAARIGASRIASRRCVNRARRVAAALAFLIGSAWATLPIFLFAPSDGDHRLIVTGTVIGVIANVYVVGPILPVCLLFVVPVVVGGFIGLARSGAGVAVPLSLLLAIYAAFVFLSCRLLHRLSTQRMVYRARVNEQDDTIGLLLRDAEENKTDWLWEINASGRLQKVSGRFAAVLDRPVEELQDAPFKTIFAPRGGQPSLSSGARAVLDAVAARKPFQDRLVEIETSVLSIWWRITGKPIHDTLGRFIGYRGMVSDITAARAADERLVYLANYDPLTGLANRALFKTNLSALCEAAAADGRCRALLYLDLDGFKGVNDSFGHGAGDLLLAAVAVRLNATIPKTAVAARLGGDEFAILYQPQEPRDAERLAASLIEAVSIPFDIQGLQATISASIGIAMVPDHCTEPDALLVKADLALYRAKAGGKRQYRVFIEEYELSLVEKRRLEDDLKLALARGEFALHYQPLVDLTDGRIVSFEALIRWHSDTRGVVSPDAFIPAAESAGLIIALDCWVLMTACREAARWPQDVAVSVNISPQHFRSADFVQDVLVVLKTSGLHPSRLEVEITEGVFLDNSPTATENLRALRQRGVRIALDDFGTGFSSLAYLIDFPVDKIKIDQSFVRHVVDRHAHRAVVDAILTLAKKLSIRVTAEGVETVEQALALKARRCDDVQGYLLARPRPATDIRTMLDDVPALFRELIPARFETPLGLALAIKKQAT